MYAPLHPGVDGSTGVETLEDVLDLTLAYDELLTALDVGRARLSGHFFGGMIAAELAALFPGRAAGLALASPLGLWRDDAPAQDILILPPDELGPILFADMTSVAARAWSALPDDDEANVAAQTESIARRAAIAKFVWPIPHKGLHNRRHRVTAATLILWGGDADRANPVMYAEEWQRRIKGAAVKLCPVVTW